MTLELWNTFATFGTFVVIAATAIAALVQLRHARGSNQIAAIAELQDTQNTPEFNAANGFVRTELQTRLSDPEFRYQLANFSARTIETQTLIAQSRAVGNYYEHLGLLVRMGLVDRDLALNLWSAAAMASWDELTPYTSITRRRWGNTVWENFEYFVVLAQDWIATHPEGDYPASVRRIALKDLWLEADTQYAASRAPA
jgi:hypothetical protein